MSSGFTTTGTTTTNETTTAGTYNSRPPGTPRPARTSAVRATRRSTRTTRVGAGVAPAATGTVGTTTDEDISGPCDEAEHANDPRCTGGVTNERRRPLGPESRPGGATTATTTTTAQVEPRLRRRPRWRRRRQLGVESRLRRRLANQPTQGDRPDEEDRWNPVRRSSAGGGARHPDDRGRRPQTVRVSEVDGRISLAPPRAGVVKFVVRNRGDDAHDFWVRGAGSGGRPAC